MVGDSLPLHPRVADARSGGRNGLAPLSARKAVSVRIEDIIDAIRHNRIRITDHADEEAQADRLSFDEIFFSVLQGEIIEDYSDDNPIPVV